MEQKLFETLLSSAEEMVEIEKELSDISFPAPPLVESYFRNNPIIDGVNRDHFPKPFQPKEIQPWVDKEIKINTEIDPSKIFHLGTHKHHLTEEISNKCEELVKDYREKCSHEEEHSLREYFLCVHNIDVDEMLSLKKNVNNLKFKHFEKRVHPFSNEYFFKGECFMTVNYENNDMMIIKHWKRK